MNSIELTKKEQQELKENLLELVDYMNSEEFYSLSTNHRSVLKNKKIAMELYLNVLNMAVYEDVDTIVVPDLGWLGMMGNLFNVPFCSNNQLVPVPQVNNNTSEEAS